LPFDGEVEAIGTVDAFMLKVLANGAGFFGINGYMTSSR